MIDMIKPYEDEQISDTRRIRTFYPIYESAEYIWHQDKRTRIVECLVDNDTWKFQYDNRLPFIINRHEIIKIPALEFHRLIPGTTVLKLLIQEL